VTDDELKRLFDEMRQENTSAHEETRRQVAALAADTQRQFADTQQQFADTRQQIADLSADTQRQFEGTRREFAAIRQENASGHAETRHQFEIVTEATKHEIRLVAESVAVVNEKLDRTAADIREEMRLGFDETQAMIRVSYTDLDRRVRALEG
jgi:hypothetical protein